MLFSKSFRAFADKINMRAIAENLARGANRILHPLNASDAPGTQRRAIHEESVHLHFAFAIKKATAPSIERLVVLKNNDSFLDRIQRAAAALEHSPPRVQGIAHTRFVRFHHVVGHGPGAAVDDENRTHSESSLKFAPSV